MGTTGFPGFIHPKVQISEEKAWYRHCHKWQACAEISISRTIRISIRTSSWIGCESHPRRTEDAIRALVVFAPVDGETSDFDAILNPSPINDTPEVHYMMINGQTQDKMISLFSNT